MTDRLETEADPEDDRKPLNPHKYIISLALTVCIGLILHEFITAAPGTGTTPPLLFSTSDRSGNYLHPVLLRLEIRENTQGQEGKGRRGKRLHRRGLNS